MPEVYDRVLGALVGVAVGDAMGMPAEMLSRPVIAELYGRIEDFVTPSSRNPITAGFAQGQVTDDTWQTLLVAQSIIENEGRIVAEDIAQRLLEWAEGELQKGRKYIGPSTQKALAALRNGEPLASTGKDGITNGGAMRMVPVGIVSCRAGDEELIENVTRACLPTHNTDVAIAAAAAVAKAVALGLRGESRAREAIEAAVEVAAQAAGKGYRTSAPSVAKRTRLALQIVEAAANEEEALAELSDIIGTGFAAAESVPTALALVYLAQGDPIRCAQLAANIGGDTDTIGAISTGIAGALQGLSPFPKNYVDLITRVNGIDLERVARELMRVQARKRYREGLWP
ncbi:MAG TPA: ADP-ribosylglycohydrolase family protein [Clostridia bacterium]|nr:ADP-ribosylglycohydrolase family protein [Clostridia bacterium]